MTAKRLDRTEWHAFLDRISKALENKLAEIEVGSLALGNQVQAEWLPLLGLVYDPKSDIVDVALEGLDHMIQKPHEIYVEDGAEGLASLEIAAADGTKQILRFKDMLLLPPPQK